MDQFTEVCRFCEEGKGFFVYKSKLHGYPPFKRIGEPYWIPWDAKWTQVSKSDSDGRDVRRYPCEFCLGTGLMPSSLGWRVLKFMKFYSGVRETYE